MHGVEGLQDGCTHVKPITIENERPKVISDLCQLSIQVRRLQTGTGHWKCSTMGFPLSKSPSGVPDALRPSSSFLTIEVLLVSNC